MKATAQCRQNVGNAGLVDCSACSHAGVHSGAGGLRRQADRRNLRVDADGTRPESFRKLLWRLKRRIRTHFDGVEMSLK